MFEYDKLAINVIVNNIKGGINSCDIPFTNDFKQFALRFRGFLVLLMCIRFLRCALGLFWFAIHDQMAKLLTFNAIWLCQIQAISF